MSKSLKLEKVTLWTAIPTYGYQGTTVSSLDYMLDTLDKQLDSECIILDYDSEDYKLTKIKN